ncbi:MAG: hypothetical protein LBS57_13585 [Treponema sp.]|jgi:hydroxymethylpyrimidine pyrophosphatase-like HAD family hydrolase|nr:hypothetical protein [Treponema sp.]
MSTVEELFKERVQVRTDLLSGKKPKRVFITPNFTMEAACGLAGVNLLEAHYNMELFEKALAKVAETFYSDVFASRSTRFAGIYQQLGAKNWIIGSNGTVQHPEIETMHTEDYDEFIAAPYKTIVEKFLPRVCTALDTDPVTRGMKLAAAYGAYKNVFAAQNVIAGKLIAQYGYVPGMITGQMIEAPFDFLADQLRGFKAITMDIRRCPDKVKAAVEVITPLIIKMATPPAIKPGIISFIPLHLGPFINKKAFEELYWPTFEKLIVELDKKGIACSLFVEQDWTRYCEYLERLPKSTIMFMEAGDPKRFTETVGKDHVFAGFYDPTITLARSKEECIDEAKRLLDICMKSDHFYFNFDKNVIDIKSVDVPKLQAVLEWVRENGKY